MFRYAVPFVFLAAVPIGALLGGVWAFAPVILAPLAIVGFDHLLGQSLSPTDGEGGGHRWIPRLYVLLQIAQIVWAAALIARPATRPLLALGVTLSTGLVGGVFGMSAAHELTHKDEALDRALGLTMLACFGYMHFSIAHLHGHHVRGATPQDPASARLGESAYAFVPRSVLGQWREAWTFEARRLSRRGRTVYGPANRMLVFAAIELAVLAAVAVFSWRAAVFWLAQAVLAVILLELFNYIAHYGLSRQRLPGGRYERMNPRHSWNSQRRMNNAALFNMGRHADHHARPAHAYQRLAPEPDSPELPTGYGGAILMALVPPLWRAVMDPRVRAWTN